MAAFSKFNAFVEAMARLCGFSGDDARRRTEEVLVRVGMHPRTAAHCARNGYTTWLSDSVRVTVSPLVVRILPGWEDGDGA